MTEILYSTPSVCESCGSIVVPHLTEVVDHVYGVKGNWNLVRCSNKECNLTYLDAELKAQDISSFYTTYSTHSGPILESSGAKRFYRHMLASIYNRRLNYAEEVDKLAAIVGRALAIVPFFAHLAKSRVFWLSAKLGGKVVEIGFGNGQALLQLQSLGWNVSGIEYDKVCIEQARERNLDVLEGDFQAEHYSPESLDAVVGSHVIEHVPSAKRLIQEICKSLQPGGCMVLVTPNGNSFGSNIFGKYWRGLETPRHLTIQTPASLRSFAKEAGFSKVNVFGTSNGGFILQQSLELALQLKPSQKQGLRTIPFNIFAGILNMINAKKSEEIVLHCVK